MKRVIFFVLTAFVLAALVSAQGWGRQGQMGNGNWAQVPAPETVTVSGPLTIANGSPALRSGEVTYLIGGINRLAGFVDGLKEGANVTVEGPAMARPGDSGIKFLRAVKLTLNGKTYDLTPLARADAAPGGPQMMPYGGYRHGRMNNQYRGGCWR